ncbi:hypothetical protein [Kribbella endophytica]
MATNSEQGRVAVVGSVRRGVAVLAAAAAVAVTGQTAATAATESTQYANDRFAVCLSNCYQRAYGGVAWTSRNATISGTVYDFDSAGYATVSFEAFRGSKKIGTQYRTSEHLSRSYRFVMSGSPDRVRVQICYTGIGNAKDCSEQQNAVRN